ncbi:hypothetical protein PGTUg99_015655 [Puccinia graminis f. sp. tritici]|uniref:Uncharacterized protein n=1 Tax=Puccinia graminis f. sp. tritici TaxID=56615 RepID=A0A5B0RV44_PUCGR|nr:hypothetical protein PGTUg99_015655 [Puccinia graminis f. sp. tritici]
MVGQPNWVKKLGNPGLCCPTPTQIPAGLGRTVGQPDPSSPLLGGQCRACAQECLSHSFAQQDLATLQVLTPA